MTPRASDEQLRGSALPRLVSAVPLLISCSALACSDDDGTIQTTTGQGASRDFETNEPPEVETLTMRWAQLFGEGKPAACQLMGQSILGLCRDFDVDPPDRNYQSSFAGASIADIGRRGNPILVTFTNDEVIQICREKGRLVVSSLGRPAVVPGIPGSAIRCSPNRGP